MNADHLLRFVFGPAALPLDAVLILYLSSVLRDGYFTSKAGNRIERDKQPANFWTGVVAGVIVSAVFIISAITFFVFDKTILEYSDSYGDHQVPTSRQNGERGSGPDAAKKQGLTRYTP